MTFIEIFLIVMYLVTLFYSVFWIIQIIIHRSEKSESRRIIGSLPKVTIAIPAYNEAETIKASLASVCGLKYPRKLLEIIVVNDGSTDKTAMIVKDFAKNHKDHKIILINQKNHGKYYAINAAIKISTGTLFACLDADSFVEPGALKTMVTYFKDKGVAVVLPLMKVASPKKLLQKIQWYEYIINMFYKRLMSYLNCIHVTPGPFSLYRKEVFAKVGLFKKAHATEDLEMALRIQKHHYQIVQLMDAVVYTVAPDNMRDLYSQRNRWNMGSVLNSWDYRAVIFNKKYGDFGFFQMPFVLGAGFISIAIIASLLYYSVIRPSYLAFMKMRLIDFDIMTIIRNFTLQFNLLDFNYLKVFIALSILLITLAVVINAQIYTKERITKHGIFPLLVFIFFYYILLGIIWLGIVKDLIFKRKRIYGKWKEKSAQETI